jgi:hypothetical protein|tara:strand:- start:3513 stop:3737 length:225 start_codon:yes stop_codon:yes gene_type:complete
LFPQPTTRRDEGEREALLKALLLEARVEEGYVWRAVAGGMIFNKAKRVFKRKSVTIGLDVGDAPPPFFKFLKEK